MKLRPYQPQAISEIRDAMRVGHRRVLLQAPTGSGKTIIACEIMKLVVERGKRVLFLADRRKLIDQAGEKLAAYGVDDYGLVMAGRPVTPSRPVQIASVQTLLSRWDREHLFPDVQLIIVDEAHKSLADGYQRVVGRFPGAYVLGMTATPVRSDGRGMGQLYDHMVHAPSILELQRAGHLVGTRYYSPSLPDLSGVRVTNGDYVESQLAEVMEDDTVLVGDILKHYRRLADGKQAVVFATSVAHSKFICNIFNHAGIPADHVDGGTPDFERQEIYARVRSGETRVLVNCNVLTEGWDEPSIEVCILARPTKSIGRYLQMAGRVLRPALDKERALIVDHAGVVRELGFVEDEQLWTLDDGKEPAERRAALKEATGPVVCPECGLSFRASPSCPQCGWVIPGKPARTLFMTRAELEWVEAAPQRELEAYKASFYQRLRGLSAEKNKKPDWVGSAFRAKFGHRPGRPLWNLGPVDPDKEIRDWETHLNIRWSKGGGRAKNPRRGSQRGGKGHSRQEGLFGVPEDSSREAP